MLESILIALAPKIVGMVIDIFTAEDTPELDTGFKKHDHVMKKVGEEISNDSAFKDIENREIMDALNPEIKRAVKTLKDAGLLKRK
jgi:hypothetical protein